VEDPSGGDFGEAARETYMLHLLASVGNYRDRELDRLFEPLGLTVEKYRSMLAIARFPDCTMTELAQFTFIDRTTLTRMVDQLVATGWVTREHAERDRRQVLMGLTPKGLAVGLQAVDLLTAANGRTAMGTGPDDIEVVIGVLKGLLRNLIPDAGQLERVITMRRS
jgi:DNA-binding MarR family transcriptional regulator